MQVYEIKTIKDSLPKLDYSSAIIGNFDGIHLGHMALIEELKKTHNKHMVISFENLYKDEYYLMNKKQKIDVFSSLDIDYLIFIDYNNFHNIFYNEFMNLLKKLHVLTIICGSDFRFGYKKEGDLIDLEKKFEVKIVPDYYFNDKRLSTSKIKRELDNDLEIANKMLNRPYEIIGKVIKGNGIGASLGYKTANIDYSLYKLPKNAVYFCIVFIDNTLYYGITSISHNPTLNYVNIRSLEVHILDFDQDIYDQEIKIQFIKQIGEIKKYDSKEELIEALNNYKKIAMKLIS